MSEPEQAAPDGRVATQLNDVRRRGIDLIDLDEGTQRRVDAPDLTALADEYGRVKALKLYGRPAHLRRLLADSLDAYAESGNQAEAAFVRELFFDLSGVTPARDASTLQNAAITQSGLTAAEFRAKRRDVFDRFAGFLATFVADAKNQPEPPEPKTEKPLGRLVVIGLIALAVVIAVVGVVLWTSRDTGGNHVAGGQSPSVSSSASQSTSAAPKVTGKTYTEISGNGKGTRVFDDPSTLAHEMAPIPFLDKVEVSCRKNVPSMPSVSWWYRLASAPYNNQWWSPAVTFLNGDDPKGPYTHDVDEAVPVCP